MSLQPYQVLNQTLSEDNFFFENLNDKGKKLGMKNVINNSKDVIKWESF